MLMYMQAHPVISSVQSNLLLKNLFYVCFPPASISFAILQVGIVRFVFYLIAKMNKCCC